MNYTRGQWYISCGDQYWNIYCRSEDGQETLVAKVVAKEDLRLFTAAPQMYEALLESQRCFYIMLTWDILNNSEQRLAIEEMARQNSKALKSAEGKV